MVEVKDLTELRLVDLWREDRGKKTGGNWKEESTPLSLVLDPQECPLVTKSTPSALDLLPVADHNGCNDRPADNLVGG